ncbi:hypothetical protein [Nonomuraea fuscirosea]|uniref:hypothetical protein n=1 Tax=Nonomuraea fuscirosea TaxID=1291556 RepID=UPI003439F119
MRLQKLRAKGVPAALGDDERNDRIAITALTYLDVIQPHAVKLARQPARRQPARSSQTNYLELPPEDVTFGIPIILAGLADHVAIVTTNHGGQPTLATLAGTKRALLNTYLDDTEELLSQREYSILTKAVSDLEGQLEMATRGNARPLTSADPVERRAAMTLLDLERFEKKANMYRKWAPLWAATGAYTTESTATATTNEDHTGGWELAAIFEEMDSEARQLVAQAPKGTDGRKRKVSPIQIAEAKRKVIDRYLGPERGTLTKLQLHNLEMLAHDLDVRAGFHNKDEVKQIAKEILDTLDRWRNNSKRFGAGQAARETVRLSLPDEKLRVMCRIDYDNLIRQVLDAHNLTIFRRSWRTLELPDEVAAKEAARALVKEFGSSGLHRVENCVILPRPSQFGITLRRKSCDCGRHR